MKKYFLSFASSDLKKSLNRIKNQADFLNFYDYVITYTEKELDSNFHSLFKENLKFGTRGFGYWCWKPQIRLQVLENMNDGDILQYSDVGCHLNIKGIERLSQYFELAKKTEKGILAFQNKPPEYPLEYDGRRMLNYLDYQWIKGDLIDHFNIRDKKDILNTVTIGATVIFIRKCEKSIELINKWLDVIKYDFKLIDDSSSKNPNMEGFQAHRHDQAIFSILCKLEDIKTLSAYEYYYPSKVNLNKPDWDILKNYPIWKKNDKKFLLNSTIKFLFFRIKNKLKLKK